MQAAPDANLAALVARQPGQHPDFRVLTFVNVGAAGALEDETRTFAELHAHAGALAAQLKALGIGPGKTFAIMMANHPEFVEAMLAAAWLGAAFVPIDPRVVGDKLRYMLEHAECEGAICTADCAAAIRRLGTPVGRLQWLVVAGDDASPDRPGGLREIAYRDAIAARGDRPPIAATAPADPMMMMFTSGTTGNPKAVVLPFGQYMAAAYNGTAFGIRDDDVLYTGLSLTHINAQTTLRRALGGALPAVISRKFTKSRLWDIVRGYDCTVFNLLGGMIPEIYATPETPEDADNPLRLVISAGMPDNLWTEYERRFGVRICEIYGSTEGGGALVNLPGEGPIGSMGRPVAGSEAACFNEAGERCKPHEPGELRFRRTDGSAITVNYLKNPDASAEKVRDGWFRTGDIAHADENGWLFFHYRVGGGVRKNGDFVSTALVESGISKSGLVADVYVYGVNTPKNVAGEKYLVAAVVPHDPATFTTAALIAYCRGHLEKNDVPDIVQVLDEIPRTISEKPIERACIELLGDPLARRPE